MCNGWIPHHWWSGNGGTFGNLTNCYLKQLLHHSSTYDTVINVLFDQHDEANSVKTDERRRHLAAMGEVLPGWLVPQWSKFMALSLNKKRLTDFFCNYKSQHAPKKMSNNPNKRIYLAGRFCDGTHTAFISSRGTKYDQQLFSMQEEADTRIFVYIKHLDSLFQQGNILGSIMIKARDKHVLV